MKADVEDARHSAIESSTSAQIPSCSGRPQTFLDIWKNTDSDLTSVEVWKARLVPLKHGY
ncbi:MAG: hypothetical protein KAR42_13355 [candidate division Zixibacteria bacterium]|nr:hypothetical protein [candidate division Zixibacteria bacterium]